MGQIAAKGREYFSGAWSAKAPKHVRANAGLQGKSPRSPSRLRAQWRVIMPATSPALYSRTGHAARCSMSRRSPGNSRRLKTMVAGAWFA